MIGCGRTDEPWAVVTFEGGPLDGIRLSVVQKGSAVAVDGVCTVTDTGPVGERDSRRPLRWAVLRRACRKMTGLRFAIRDSIEVRNS